MYGSFSFGKTSFFNQLNTMAQIIDLKRSEEKKDDKQISQHETNLNLILSINPGKVNYSIKEVAAILSLSYEFVRESIKKEQIKATRYGDRYLVNVNEIARLLTEGL